jgi:hypothetical protein
MPIFDRTIQLKADPEAIGSFIQHHLPGSGSVQVLRPAVLYRLNRDGLGHVFLLRPADQGTTVRLLGDEQQQVDIAFRAPNPRDAMLALTALPPAGDMDAMRLIPHFERALSQVAARFDPFSELAGPSYTGPDPLDAAASSGPTYNARPAGAPPPAAEPTAAGPRPGRTTTEMPMLANVPLKEPKSPTRSRGSTLIYVLAFIAVVIVAGLGVFTYRRTLESVLNAASNIGLNNLDVEVQLPPPWQKKDFTNVPGCKQLGFTCLLAADIGTNSDVSMVLGSTLGPQSALDLGKLEKDTWATLQNIQTGMTKLSVDYLKIGGVQAIRRYYTFSISLAPGSRGYAMQIYFASSRAIYELTVASVDQVTFRSYSKDINALLSSITVK